MSKAKRIAKVMKIEFNAMQAKPGPGLAAAGINMPDFCNQFNDKTKERAGEVVPVVITIFEDKSFEFLLKTTPASNMLKKVAGITKGSGSSKTTKVATITKAQLQEVAEYKMPDLNANDIEAAMKIVAGTARNMGIEIEG